MQMKNYNKCDRRMEKATASEPKGKGDRERGTAEMKSWLGKGKGQGKLVLKAATTSGAHMCVLRRRKIQEQQQQQQPLDRHRS